MTLLSVKNLKRAFSGVVAVNDVSFDMGEGEIVGLMGANGAGKTTLFAMIAGNVKPTSGTIELAGRRIDGMGPDGVNRLGVSRTFQIVRPFASMTVLDNVMIGQLYGRSRTRSLAEARRKSWAVLEEVKLADQADKLAGSLTLAGRKRLEVARALATDPKILLLDEVLAGLNASEANDALELIRHLRESRSLSILIIEHVMKALMRLSHRIIVLHDGRKIMEGDPAAVARDPRVIKAYLGEKRNERPA